jgi:hypothetical protein
MLAYRHTTPFVFGLQRVIVRHGGGLAASGRRPVPFETGGAKVARSGDAAEPIRDEHQAMRRKRLLPGIFVLVTFAAAFAGVARSLAAPGSFTGIGLLLVAALAAVAGWLALGAPVSRAALRPPAA